MLKAIAFDFDGVLVNSEPLHYRAFLLVAQELGVTFDYPAYLKRYVGYDDRDSFRAMLHDAHRAQEAADESLIADLCRRKGDAFEDVVNQGIAAFPGVLEFIDLIGAQMPLAIASGATRRDLDLILRQLGVGERFDPIVSTDLVHRSKPHPQTYALAVEGLARRLPEGCLAAHECLAIEDTAAGVESARGAGLWTLALTTSFPSGDLQRAHRVISTLQGLTIEQLHEWFD
jgi:beta-phosphoglucomutase